MSAGTEDDERRKVGVKEVVKDRMMDQPENLAALENKLEHAIAIYRSLDLAWVSREDKERVKTLVL